MPNLMLPIIIRGCYTGEDSAFYRFGTDKWTWVPAGSGVEM